MKQYDLVELVSDNEKYIREGVKKGMRGVLYEPPLPDGRWEVNFSGDEYEFCGVKLYEDIFVVVDEKDLIFVR